MDRKSNPDYRFYVSLIIFYHREDLIMVSGFLQVDFGQEQIQFWLLRRMILSEDFSNHNSNHHAYLKRPEFKPEVIPITKVLISVLTDFQRNL